MKTGILILVLQLLFSYGVSAQDEFSRISESEFAEMIVKAAGYDKDLPPEPKDADYISVLRHHGIEPLDGWQPARILTIGRFSTVMIQARGIKRAAINDADRCAQNIYRINEAWFSMFKRQGKWPGIQELLQAVNFEGEIPVCPFKQPYVDADSDRLVDLHYHRGAREAVDDHVRVLRQRMEDEKLLVPQGPSRRAVYLAQARDTIKDLAGAIGPAEPILTDATHIYPLDMPAQIGAERGRLVFVVYENGSLKGRKVEWPASFDPNQNLEVSISYSNTARLPGSKSIRMFINNVEVGSAEGRWGEAGFFNNIWIGAQSQTGQFPSNSYVYDLRVYKSRIRTDPMDLRSGDIVMRSKLDTPEEVANPQISARRLRKPVDKVTGEVPAAVLKAQGTLFAKGQGFISRNKNQYVVLPSVLDPKEGSLSLVLKPGFVYSDNEHVFLSAVQWDSPDGADGFYLYYQPE
ncbi:MAG: hypothetical protein PHR44_00695 [Candidatus Omnitrophica bacterium]|nr:hypothetical protein [Candidatus Omnitrophota bacterium]